MKRENEQHVGTPFFGTREGWEARWHSGMAPYGIIITKCDLDTTTFAYAPWLSQDEIKQIEAQRALRVEDGGL